MCLISSRKDDEHDRTPVRETRVYRDSSRASLPRKYSGEYVRTPRRGSYVSTGGESRREVAYVPSPSTSRGVAYVPSPRVSREVSREVAYVPSPRGSYVSQRSSQPVVVNVVKENKRRVPVYSY